MEFLKYSFSYIIISTKEPIYTIDIIAENEEVAKALAKNLKIRFKLISTSEDLESEVNRTIYSEAYREEERKIELSKKKITIAKFRACQKFLKTIEYQAWPLGEVKGDIGCHTEWATQSFDSDHAIAEEENESEDPTVTEMKIAIDRVFYSELSDDEEEEGKEGTIIIELFTDEETGEIEVLDYRWD